jgi:hypothetical protein
MAPKAPPAQYYRVEWHFGYTATEETVFKQQNYQQARKQKAAARKARQDEKLAARRSARQATPGDNAEQSPALSTSSVPGGEDGK